jgi:hypothetical protein
MCKPTFAVYIDVMICVELDLLRNINIVYCNWILLFAVMEVCSGLFISVTSESKYIYVL